MSNKRDFDRKYNLIASERFASIVALSSKRQLLIEGHISVGRIRTFPIIESPKKASLLNKSLRGRC